MLEYFPEWSAAQDKMNKEKVAEAIKIAGI